MNMVSIATLTVNVKVFEGTQCNLNDIDVSIATQTVNVKV